MTNDYIPFNKPFMTGKELHYISQAHHLGQLAGDGAFTKKSQAWLEKTTNAKKVLLTHSCTAALEMSALLLDIEPGDEVIMPSYTFVSSANAFVLRGATPVFVDIREDTLNIDEKLIESAITDKTKCILVVHYAGVACEMDEINRIATQHGIAVVEDAAQGVCSYYKGTPLGSLSDIGCYSFHETKNIISGEGGALLINKKRYINMAEIIWEKGTDRSQYFRGEVDKYTWQNVGSSFLPGELIAAFLWAQLECSHEITSNRVDLWGNYHNLLSEAENKSKLRRPVVPEECKHNAHMYYIILPEYIDRAMVIQKLKEKNIHTVFHYVPLHLSPKGKKSSRVSGSMQVTEKMSASILRLPMWIGLEQAQQEYIADTLLSVI